MAAHVVCYNEWVLKVFACISSHSKMMRILESRVKLHHGPKEHVNWEGKSLLLHLIQVDIIMVVIIWGLVDCTVLLQELLPN